MYSNYLCKIYNIWRLRKLGVIIIDLRCCSRNNTNCGYYKIIKELLNNHIFVSIIIFQISSEVIKHSLNQDIIDLTFVSIYIIFIVWFINIFLVNFSRSKIFHEDILFFTGKYFYEFFSSKYSWVISLPNFHTVHLVYSIENFSLFGLLHTYPCK